MALLTLEMSKGYVLLIEKSMARLTLSYHHRLHKRLTASKLLGRRFLPIPFFQPNWQRAQLAVDCGSSVAIGNIDVSVVL